MCIDEAVSLNVRRVDDAADYFRSVLGRLRQTCKYTGVRYHNIQLPQHSRPKLDELRSISHFSTMVYYTTSIVMYRSNVKVVFL